MCRAKKLLRYQYGFTLIELAVVLVIIGLIIGGILVGRDLVRSAEINSVVKDISAYRSASRTFQDKFNCFPGDCVKATQFGLGMNGDGNGYIGLTTGYETRLFWIHLAAAGMIGGTYSLPSPCCYQAYAEAGEVPSTKLSGAWVSVFYAPSGGAYTPGPGDIMFPGMQNKPVFIVGGRSGGYYYSGYGPYIISSSEMLRIDQKYDEGTPGNGLIGTVPWYDPGYHAALQNWCVTSTDPTVSKYDTTRSGNVCSPFFAM